MRSRSSSRVMYACTPWRLDSLPASVELEAEEDEEAITEAALLCRRDSAVSVVGAACEQMTRGIGRQSKEANSNSAIYRRIDTERSKEGQGVWKE